MKPDFGNSATRHIWSLDNDGPRVMILNASNLGQKSNVYIYHRLKDREDDRGQEPNTNNSLWKSIWKVHTLLKVKETIMWRLLSNAVSVNHNLRRMGECRGGLPYM